MVTKKKPDAPMVKVRLVPEMVAKALANGKGRGIDSGKLLTALLEKWGGCDRFAADIHAEYQKAHAGSMTRQRILEMLTRLTVQVTSQETARPKSAREMSDAELLATARTLLERINGPDPAPVPQETRAELQGAADELHADPPAPGAGTRGL